MDYLFFINTQEIIYTLNNLLHTDTEREISSWTKRIRTEYVLEPQIEMILRLRHLRHLQLTIQQFPLVLDPCYREAK